MNYTNLTLFGMIPYGGSGNIPTSVKFSDFKVSSSHLSAYLLIGAVNGSSSPVTIQGNLVSGAGLCNWVVQGTAFDLAVNDSSPISWNSSSCVGTLTTSAPIGNDSKGIVINLGSLSQYSSILVKSNQSRTDGIAFSIGEAASGTTVTLNPTSSTVQPGQAISFTATVLGNSPSGNIQFLVNGVNFGSPQTLTNGSSTINIALTDIGANTITAAYLGDANNPASTSVNYTMLVSATTTTPASSVVPAITTWGTLLLTFGLMSLILFGSRQTKN